MAPDGAIWRVVSSYSATNVHAEPNKRWLTVSALAILGPNGVQWRAGNVKATATA